MKNTKFPTLFLFLLCAVLLSSVVCPVSYAVRETVGEDVVLLPPANERAEPSLPSSLSAETEEAVVADDMKVSSRFLELLTGKGEKEKRSR